jgi:hypothetical protein
MRGSTYTRLAHYLNLARIPAVDVLQPGTPLTEISKKKLGANHPNILTIINNFAFTRKEQGQDSEAIKLIKKCILLQMHVFGTGHPHILSFLAALVRWNDGSRGTIRLLRSQTKSLFQPITSKPPLLPSWEIRKTAESKVYYMNHNTKTTSLAPPNFSSSSGLSLPSGWEKRITVIVQGLRSIRLYYYDIEL